MIPAHQSRPHRWLLRRYLDWIWSQDFQGIQLLGGRPALPSTGPVMLPSNHTSWWDAFFALLLAERVFDRPLYTLALVDTVRRFPFFTKVGCYGFDAADKGDVRAMLRWTSDLLDGPERPLLLYFPEGRLTPDVKAPYALKHGLRALTPNTPTPMVPLYVSLHFLNERKPTVFLALGEPLSFQDDYAANPRTLEEAFDRLRARTHDAIARGEWGETLVGKAPRLRELGG
jgi:1-acyl-sn-glycerol-3-phosphate acyltransferase